MDMVGISRVLVFLWLGVTVGFGVDTEGQYPANNPANNPANTSANKRVNTGDPDSLESAKAELEDVKTQRDVVEADIRAKQQFYKDSGEKIRSNQKSIHQRRSVLASENPEVQEIIDLIQEHESEVVNLRAKLRLLQGADEELLRIEQEAAELSKAVGEARMAVSRTVHDLKRLNNRVIFLEQWIKEKATASTGVPNESVDVIADKPSKEGNE
jgi:chromosome segregation ATPase